ncbi:MAG: SusC/RagA family TonB-linked outer membrane protein [Polaromonas sp.]|nr:SusC/RagA family TonB-linked outer membrane protein [Gemmatimonadaceae bacterium]
MRSTLGASSPLYLLAFAAIISAPALHAQATGTITGTVLDRGSRRPLAGAQITVAGTGTTVGAASNAQGVFRILNVTPGTRIVRSRLLGYGALSKSVVVDPGGTATVEFELSQSALELTEVVTTGTGGSQVEARKLGNTVASVQAPANAPISNFSDILQGREPGVVILPSSGTTGEGARIRIRGSASLSQSNEPIVYVDGVRVDNGGGFGSGYVGTGGGGRPSRLDDIDPSAVEKIEVLKGAAAATLYGTEASNGVLLITTKRGTNGAPKWVFEVDQAAKTYPTNRIQAEWGFARTDSQATRLSQHYGFPITAFTPFSRDVATKLFETGRASTLNGQVSGGTALITYFGSLRGYREDGPFTAKNFDYQGLGVNMADIVNRYQGTLGLGLAPTKTFKLQTNVLYANTHNEIPENNNSIYAPYTVALFSKPENAQCTVSKTSATDPTNGSNGDGTCRGPGNPTGASSFASERELLQPTTKQDSRHFNGSLRASYIPLASFNLDGTFGVDFTSQRSAAFIPFGNNLDQRINRANAGRASVDDRSHQEITLSVNGGYSGQLISQLSSNLIFGAQGFLTRETDESGQTTSFPGPGISVLGGGATPQAFESFGQIVNTGVFAQEQLGFHDWMFVTGGARYDRNSAFGKSSGGVIYPQGSLSIIPSDRPAWKESRISNYISTFRLRAAVGRAGRQPGAFDKLTTYQALASSTGAGLVPGNLGNPDLKPEVSTEFEFGTEVGLLGDRASLEFTRWQRRVKDALYARQFPVTGGFVAAQLDNIGQLDAFGWDLKGKAFVLNRPNVSLDVYANTGFLSQIVTSLGGAPPVKVGGSYPRYRNFVKEGYAPGSFFGAKLPGACAAGATKTPQGGVCLQPGQFPFDVNKDGKPDTQAELLAYLAGPRSLSNVDPLAADDNNNGDKLDHYDGKPFPDFEGSFGGTMTLHRNWKVGTNFEYRAGHYTISNLTDAFRTANPTNGGNTELRARTEATILNPASTPQERLDAALVYAYKLKALSPYDGLNQQFAGDFLRWRELSLTYLLPARVAAPFGASDMAITFAARNFALWTKYPGVDPEINIFGRSSGGSTDANFGEGIDAFGFPLPRSLSLNLRMSF